MPKDPQIQDAVIRHAQNDMAANPAASHDVKEPSLRERNAAKLPGFWAEMSAIAREGIKDVRQTMEEVMLSQGEHSPEPGAPLNPTQIMATDDLRPDEFDRSIHDYASRGTNDNDRSRSR